MKTAIALLAAILIVGCATSTRTPEQMRADVDKANEFRRILGGR